MECREVKTGTVEVTYYITEWDREDGAKVYEWRSSNGEESMDPFDTIEEAEDDAIGSL